MINVVPCLVQSLNQGLKKTREENEGFHDSRRMDTDSHDEDAAVY